MTGGVASVDDAESLDVDCAETAVGATAELSTATLEAVLSAIGEPELLAGAAPSAGPETASCDAGAA